MPTYIAVCCYQCKMFQGQQENKQKKFKCKVCGAKQSFRHIFAKSDYPKDIRGVVQELNKKRMEDGAMLDQTDENDCDAEREDLIRPKSENKEEGSKWAAFIETVANEEPEEADDPRFITDSSVLVNEAKRRKRSELGENRFQRKRKIRVDQKETSGDDSFSPEQDGFYKEMKVDTVLEESVSHPETSIQKATKEVPTNPTVQEEERYVTDLDAPDEKEESPSSSAAVSLNSKWSSFM